MNNTSNPATITSAPAKVGLVAVGHLTYWEQFEGLLDELLGKYEQLATKIEAFNTGVQLEKFGMIDEATSAYATVETMKAANLDLLFVDMVTYATSSTFGILIRELNIPFVLVALQPLSAMEYTKATTYIQLCNDDFCSVPEFMGVAERMGKPMPDVILGMRENDPQADAQIQEWCRVAHVVRQLKTARIGLMGHVLEAMLDMHTDPTAITSAFGAHVVLCEPDSIVKHYRSVDDEALKAKSEEILEFFDTPDPGSDSIAVKLTDADLETAARCAVALERFIEEKALTGLAYYYEGEAGSDVRKVMTNLIVGNSILTGNGFPMCGEFDIKNCVAMMIMDRLGIGGSFAEFHPVDFERDSVLVGHDGPHHIKIADGKPVLRSLEKYHGKPGSGASVEFRLKTGPITMLSIGVKPDGQFKFIIAEGESLEGPIPATGNTNTHAQFKPDVRTFLKRWVMQGPTHHFALGIGHHACAVVKIANTLGIESVVIDQNA
jgi:L-arabinose isomerase